MDIELWKKYVDAKRHGDLDEKLTNMFECAEMEEDEILCRDARYDLGKLFLEGNGVEKDREQAIELLKSAADMGHIQAIELVGSMLIADGFEEEGNTYLKRAENNKLPEEELNKIADNIARMMKRMF